MANLSAQVAVVTGGESGIGLGIAEQLAAAGTYVVIGGILPDAGREAIAKIKAAGGKSEFHAIDVREANEVEELVAAAEKNFDRLDIMVNNAGVFDGFTSVLETSEALWDKVIDINLKGCFLGSRAALRVMLPRGTGKIINVSSVGGLRGGADGASYTASKFAIIGLTRQMACTYAEKGIAVNAICPGVIQTNIRANSARILGVDAPAMAGIGVDPDGYKRLVPARRRGLPQEVGDLAVYLASDQSGYIHGQAIAIDGGWTAT